MTKNTFYRAALKTSAASLVLSIGLIAGPAFAQTAATEATEANAADEADTIVVTGSRIARPDLEASSPVAVLGSQEFQLSGTPNVEEVIYDLPQVVPSFGAASNNPGDGSAQVDLRALGAARTLVLVNGRRYIPYDVTQLVDLNTVPAALIERVDVVTGGRSAVYGSDAIAGVVNFVLKDDFEGAQISSQYRITERGDGGTFNTDLLLGGNFADGRGNATVYAHYAKRKPIFQRDRGFSSVTISDDGDGGTFLGGSSTVPQLRAVINGTNTIFNPDGTARAYSATTDAYNFAPENYLQVPQERWFFGGFANYEINEQVELYAETQFVNNRVTTELAPTPVTAAAATNPAQLIVNVNQPGLPASTRALLAAFDAVQTGAVGTSGVVNVIGDNRVTLTNFGRRVNETGSRTSANDRNAYRGLIGARGDLGGDWGYDMYYSYARTSQLESQFGNVSRSRFNAAVAQCPAGSPVGCVPINIFGAGNISQAGVDYISVDTKNSTTVVEQVVNGTVNNGNLFDLGFGADPVGLAVGFEWRSEKGEFAPDFILSSGDVVGFNGGQPTVGRYDVKEVFGELVVPVVADRPFFHKLELNGAVRYSDYSNQVGNAFTWAAGGQWAPIEDITFRGNYQRAIRAPSVSALFLGNSEGFPAFADVCQTAAAGTNATLRANCIANGVPAAAVGAAIPGNNAQTRTTFGGNPNLREEKADTYTIGAIITPRAVPGFTFTVDYYNIKIEDAILAAGPGPSNIRDACFGIAANNFTPFDPSFCSLIERDAATGLINNIVNTNLNAGFFKVRGVDFEARYGMDLGFGFLGAEDSRLEFRLSGTRLLEYTNNNLAAIPDLVIQCDGKFGAFCGDPLSDWRGSLRTTFNTGPFTTSLLLRYIGEADDDGQSGFTVSTDHLKAAVYTDLTFNYQINDTVDFTFGVDNLFDKDVPIIGDLNNQQANTFPSTYDPYGRRYFIGVTATF